MRKLFFVLTILFLAQRFDTYSQCISPPSFALIDTICQFEQISYGFNDSGFVAQTWIANPPVVNAISSYANLGNFNNSLTTSTSGIRIVEHNGQYHAFIKKGLAKDLYRLDFGNSLNNTPTEHPIGVPAFTGDIYSSAGAVELIYKNGTWYGYTTIYPTNRIIRYTFSDSLTTDTVSVTTILNPSNQLNYAFNIKVIDFQDSIYLIAASYINNSIVIYNFGTDPENNTPLWHNTIALNSLTPSFSNATGIEAHFTCEKKIIFCTGNVSDNVIRCDFGADLTSSPTIEVINTSPIDYAVSPKMTYHQGYPELIIKSRSNSNNITRIAFKDSIDQPVATLVQSNISGFNSQCFSLAMDVACTADGLYLFFVAVAGSSNPTHLIKLTYPYISIGPTNFSQQQHANLLASATGNHVVSFQATDTNGQIYCLRDSLLVLPKPHVQASVNHLCFGDSAALNASDTSGLGNLSWVWYNPNLGYFANQDSALFSFPDTGLFEITTIANANGCVDSTVNTIRILDLPQASFFADSTCQGALINLTNQSLLSVYDTLANYQWQLDTAIVASTFEPLLYVNDSGLYELTLSIVTANGCANTHTDSVFVKPSPIADFTVQNTCLQDTTQFLNLSPNAANYSSNWWFGNGTFANQTNPAAVFQDTGNYQVLLVMTAANGCADSIEHTTRISLPAAITWSIAALCQENENVVNDSIFTSEQVVSKRLILGNDTFLQNFNSITPSDSGILPAYYTLITGQHCVQDSFFTTYVNPIPNLDITVDRLCETESSAFSFSASGLGNQAIYTNQWLLNQQQISMNAIAHHVFQSDSSYLLSLQVFTDSGCLAQQDTLLNVLKAPAIDFNLSSPYCAGAETNLYLVFSTDSTDGIDTITLQNIINQDSQYVALTNTITINNQGPQTYFISMLTEGGCTAQKSKAIVAAAPPQFEAPIKLGCVENIANLNAGISGSNYQYNWAFQNGLNYFTSQISVPLLTAGRQAYSLTILDKATQCSSTDSGFVYSANRPSIAFTDSALCPNQLNSLIPVIEKDSADSIAQYTWKLDGKIISNNQELTAFIGTANPTISLALETNIGCEVVESATFEVFAPFVPEIVIEKPVGVVPFQTEISTNLTGNFYWILNDQTFQNLQDTHLLFDSEEVYEIKLISLTEQCAFENKATIYAYYGLVDLAVKQISLTNNQPTVEIENRGTIDVTQFNLQLTADQNFSFVDSIYQTIKPGQTKAISYPQFEMNPQQQICANITSLIDFEDANLENNIGCADKNDLRIFFDADASSLNAMFTANKMQNGTLSIFDASGKLVSLHEWALQEGFNRKIMRSPSLTAGIYIAILNLENSTYTNRFVR